MIGNDRLNPTIFHTRYVHLSQLRDATMQKIQELTAENKELLLVDFGCGDMPTVRLLSHWWASILAWTWK